MVWIDPRHRSDKGSGKQDVSFLNEISFVTVFVHELCDGFIDGIYLAYMNWENLTLSDGSVTGCNVTATVWTDYMTGSIGFPTGY